MTGRSRIPAGALILIFGCTDRATGLSNGDGGKVADGGKKAHPAIDTGTLVPLPPCEPTFDSIQKNIFAIACGVDACHGVAIPAWGLTLTDGARARARLVGKPSQSCGEFYLVVPGSPEQSFLWMKVSMPQPPCGEPMPRGGPPLAEWSKVCIRDWIRGLGSRVDASADSGRRD